MGMTMMMTMMMNKSRNLQKKQKNSNVTGDVKELVKKTENKVGLTDEEKKDKKLKTVIAKQKQTQAKIAAKGAIDKENQRKKDKKEGDNDADLSDEDAEKADNANNAENEKVNQKV